MMVSTTPTWEMEPTTSSLGAMSHYHQAKARGALKHKHTYVEKWLSNAQINQNSPTIFGKTIK
jgi:hypothetical protein